MDGLQRHPGNRQKPDQQQDGLAKYAFEREYGHGRETSRNEQYDSGMIKALQSAGPGIPGRSCPSTWWNFGSGVSGQFFVD